MDEDTTLHGQDNKALQDDRFLRLLLGNHRSIYAFILALVHDPHDADDIMQETVTLMWRKFSTFETGTNFTSWGVAIARYKTMKFFEKHKNSRLKFTANIIDAIDNHTTSKLDQMKDTITALKSCLSKLGKHHRQLIQMRYEQNIPTRKVADLVGLPAHTIYRTMARIHRSLERCIRRTLAKEELA
jgi:RNA polymerase sigma-70 factor (ECF subfamily)